MLTHAQREEFEQTGMLRLTGAFGVRAAQQMTTRIWELLERSYAVRRDDARSWNIPHPTGFQTLTRTGAFDAIASAALCEDIDQLLDTWERPKHWGAPLVAFPDATASWDVPSTQWHLDFPARGALHPLPGIRVLAFIDRVEACNGGTLALSGSHHLVESLMTAGLARGGHSSEVRDALVERYEWLGRLWRTNDAEERIATFMHDGVVIEGQVLRVVELTGGPGDVVLLHPRLFHAPSHNVGAKPRLMLSQSLFRRR